MKNHILILIFTLLSYLLDGQTIKRVENENIEHFASRNNPGGTIIDTDKGGAIIETKWDSVQVIIAFYGQKYKLPISNDPSQEDCLRLVGCVYFQTEKNVYQKAIIDTIDEEGDAPQIESVFFAKATKSNQKDLILIASYNQRHYDFSGTLYETFIYHKSVVNDRTILKYDKDLSEKLSGGCDCENRDGTKQHAKYKTAKEIRLELKNLGY